MPLNGRQSAKCRDFRVTIPSGIRKDRGKRGARIGGQARRMQSLEKKIKRAAGHYLLEVKTQP